MNPRTALALAFGAECAGGLLNRVTREVHAVEKVSFDLWPGETLSLVGSKMVVSAGRIFDTIGGGHLEYKAMEIAREMLASGSQQTRLERFSLGASLGQCCGGVAVLLFEPMGQVQAQIAVFGAGHVARALVPLLASLPCLVRWIDSREIGRAHV